MKRSILAIILLLPLFLQAQPVRIWEGTGLGSKKVVLPPFIPDGDGPFQAVIVCPGGSYFWLDKENEGIRVAEWLRSEGIAAFVLYYRTGGWAGFSFATKAAQHKNRHPAMIQDIQRAITIVRKGASDYRIDPGKLGVMGFSAGGHLVASAALYCDTDFTGIADGVSLKPDFSAPIYPVVTMEDGYVHKRSRRGLLGEKNMDNKVMRDSLSLERHVTPAAPPFFVLACKDDPIVDYHNSVVLDSALTAAGVPHEFTLYNEGGHGFGAVPEKQGPETSQWQKKFLAWFHSL